MSAYLETALWSSMDDDGGPLHRGNYVFAPGVAEALDAEADAWLETHADLIDGAYQRETDDEHAQAAHDLWLTRNRHGAGFWDGDWTEPAATALTAAATAAGERNLYVGDDGLIYCAEVEGLTDETD